MKHETALVFNSYNFFNGIGWIKVLLRMKCFDLFFFILLKNFSNNRLKFAVFILKSVFELRSSNFDANQLLQNFQSFQLILHIYSLEEQVWRIFHILGTWLGVESSSIDFLHNNNKLHENIVYSLEISFWVNIVKQNLNILKLARYWIPSTLILLFCG